MTPRYYQVEAVEAVWKYFNHKSGNPLLCLPTGTGKSIIIAMLLKKIFELYPNQKILIITHVKELIQQNYEKLKILWPTAPVGIYSAGLKQKDYKQPIIFCGIQTVAKKAKLFGHVDLIIIDEAHLVSHKGESSYRTFISELKTINSYLKIIGLTATPFRTGFGFLTDAGIFTDIAYDITQKNDFIKLIDEGFLSPLIPARTSYVLDTNNVAITNGEFNQKELQNAVDNDLVTQNILKESVLLAMNRNKWLVFAAGVKHAQNICNILNEMEITTTIVTGELSDGQRDKNINDFKKGKYKAIVNYGVLTTGFDCPEIDCIIMLRPTISPVLWVQMLGRGTRIAKGKENCLVLDYAGNTERLGAINEPKIPMRKKVGAKKRKNDKEQVKICPICKTINAPHNIYCDSCNYFFKGEKLTTYSSALELIATKTLNLKYVKADAVKVRYYRKGNNKPCIKIDYHFGFCGAFKITEFLFPLHDGYANTLYEKWLSIYTILKIRVGGVKVLINDADTDMLINSYISTIQNTFNEFLANNNEVSFIVDFSQKYTKLYARYFNGVWFKSLKPVGKIENELFTKLREGGDGDADKLELS